MKYRRLGRTNLDVSVIGHGLWGMGGWSGSDDAESEAALVASIEAGCNFYDTAWAYGDGKSDELLGKLAGRNSERRPIMASKVPPMNLKWPASSEDPLSDVYPQGYVNDIADKILRAFGTDTIDLLQFHVWDDAWTDDDEWKRTVEDLKASGKIRYFGISLNRWEPWNGIKAVETGLIDTVQVIYNIFDQAPEDELFPACRKQDVGVIARVPLDEGSLGGKFTLETQFPDEDWRAKYFGPENLGPTVERVDKIKSVLPEGASLPDVALRFILRCEDVATTIVGMRRLEHVQANLSAGDGDRLDDPLYGELRKHRWDREVTPWAN